MILTISPSEYIKKNRCIGPVTSPLIFLGKTKSFHPEGLYSEDIFGLEGSMEWNKNVSWIELNCNVIHPLYYDTISKKLDRSLVDLLSGSREFNISETGQLIAANVDEEGELKGYTDFYNAINKGRYKFRMDEVDKGKKPTHRNKLINNILVSIDKGKFFQNRLLVIAPSARPINITLDTDEVIMDDLSKIYQKVIRLSIQLRSVGGDLYDVLSYKMQLLMVEIYDYIKAHVSKKTGIIRNLILGRRIDFSARSVITPDNKIKVGYVGLPLHIVCGIYEPFLIYGLMNSDYSKNIPIEFHQEVINYLGKNEAWLKDPNDNEYEYEDTDDDEGDYVE